MPFFQSFQDELTKPRGTAERLVWAVVAAVVPTAIRWALDHGANGVPFVTYFPAVFLAGLFLGWRYSLLVIVLSALAARLLFMHGPSFEYKLVQFVILGFFLLSCALLVLSSEALRQTVLALKRRAEAEIERNIELQHRVGNLLTVLCWKEMGGPPVTRPSRKGLGSRLLSSQSGIKSVTVAFKQEGLFCMIQIECAALLA